MMTTTKERRIWAANFRLYLGSIVDGKSDPPDARARGGHRSGRGPRALPGQR